MTRLRTNLCLSFLVSVTLSAMASTICAQSFNSEWDATEATFPNDDCPAWADTVNTDGELPAFNGDSLVLSTSDIAEIMKYSLEEPSMVFPDTLVLEFEMRYVVGVQDATPRSGAGVVFNNASQRGNVLFIAQDRIYLWSAHETVGSQAFVDTDDSAHTYRITATSGNSVWVDYDGATLLTGTMFAKSIGPFPPFYKVIWGDFTGNASATSRWTYFKHNAYAFDADTDGDGVLDSCDLCAGGIDSLDADGDSVPDLCDVCPGFDDFADSDGDAVPDSCDVCSGFDDSVDSDFDSVPDGCDVCAGGDDGVDSDVDTTPDSCDNCPAQSNPAQTDTDGDSIGDSCDKCPAVADPPQMDTNGNGIGDLCEVGHPLKYMLFSPVDMVVTDPKGDSIGIGFNTIGLGSSYDTTVDLNSANLSGPDGNTDDSVTIAVPVVGDYQVRLIPEPGSPDSAKFTLSIRIDGNELMVPDDYYNTTVTSIGTTIPDTYVFTVALTLPGDANADGAFTSADIIFLVNHVFKGGAAPNVPGHGDCNCDEAVTSADIIYLVNHVFKGGQPPCSQTVGP